MMAKFGARFIILRNKLKSNNSEMIRKLILELMKMQPLNLRLMLEVPGEVDKLILVNMEINHKHMMLEPVAEVVDMMLELVVEGMMKANKTMMGIKGTV